MHDEWTRLARYFAGECTPEEAEATRLWIEADPERQRLADELRAAWGAAAKPPVPPAKWDTPSAWQRLSARLRTRERRPHPGVVRSKGSVHTTRRERRRQWGVAVAAAAVVLAIAGGVVWRRGTERSAQIAVAIPMREVRTVPGQRAILTLGDGSRVVLGPASVLRYDTTRFAVQSRQLELEGEAHFTVAHAGANAPPFLVRTSRGTIRDIGTAFNVRDFATSARLEVVVSDGAVVLAGRTLKRGDLARVDSAGALQLKHGVNVDRYIAWTEGRLAFDELPLRDLIPELERWYDLDITLADQSLAERRFVGTLYEGAASSALDLLAISLDLRVQREGRAVLLSPK